MAYYHHWMFELHVWMPWVWIALLWLATSLYLSLFYGASLWLFNRIRAPWLFPCCWIVGEWLRSLGVIGNPAGVMGYTQTSILPVLQLASVFGVFGVSFFVVFVNTALFYRRWIPLTVGVLCVLGFGFYRLLQPADGPTIRVALVQPNHAQTEKLDGANTNHMLANYLQLTQQALLEKPDLVIWPETITPTLNLRNWVFVAQLSGLARSANVSILFGTPLDENGRYYNSLVLMTPTGLSPTLYKKMRLMPFGEYWPLKKASAYLGLGKWAAGADYSAGGAPTLMQAGTIKIGGRVCLESIYPWFFRDMKDADILAVFANNAWFFDSIAAEEHFQMSQVRAVENNRYLIQCANTGISGFVSNTGAALQKTTLDTQATLTTAIPTGLPPSLYSLLGDIIVYLAIGLILWQLGSALISTKLRR